MGNKDHAVSCITNSVHYFEQFLTAFLSKCCRCLINYQNLRIEISCLYDLNQLSVLEVIIVDNFGRINVVEAIAVQIFLCLFVHGCCVLDAVSCKFIFVSKKNVFCYGQTGKCSDLLYDDRNSLMICLYLVCSCDLLAFQDKFTGILLIDTCQTGSKCGFTGTIFTDQCMDLAFFEGKGNVVQGMCDAKMFINIFCS